MSDDLNQSSQSASQNQGPNRNPGQLFVVATPIGNLQDFTMRAIEVLQHVDLIAAEDTRHSRKLLMHYGIKTPCVALHEHNEREQIEKIVALLRDDKNIALISDAGTPLISDPGYHLVRHCVSQHIRVQPVPGPSASIAALSAAGLASDRFCFEGFPAAKSAARIQAFQARQLESATLIYFLSPHRWQETLMDMLSVFGADRGVVLAREISKIHETFHRAPLRDLIEWMAQNPQQQKGEMVLLVEGNRDAVDPALTPQTLQWLRVLLKELPPSRASAVLADMLGLKKKVLYDMALQIQHDPSLGAD